MNSKKQPDNTECGKTPSEWNESMERKSSRRIDWLVQAFKLILPIALCLALPIDAWTQRFDMFGTELEAFGDFYSVDVSDGSLTTLGQSSSFFAGLEFDASGNLWGASTSLGRINPEDGSVIEERMINFLSGEDGFDILSGLTISPSGEFYGVGNLSGRIWNIDPETADATLVHDFGLDLFSIEFADDGTLYGAGFDLYELDLESMTSLRIGNVGQLVSSLDFAPNGIMYGASGVITTDSLFSIDLESGASKFIGVTGGNLTALASRPIPEPLSFGIVLITLAISASSRRRPRAGYFAITTTLNRARFGFW